MQKRSSSSEVTYHAHDFDWCDLEAEYASEMHARESNLFVPPHHPSTLAENWEVYHRRHLGASYRPRKYIVQAFPVLLETCGSLVEIGAGHGCTIFPLLQRLIKEPDFKGLTSYVFDCSETAIRLLREHSDYRECNRPEERCALHAFVGNIVTDDFDTHIPPESVDVILMVSLHPWFTECIF